MKMKRRAVPLGPCEPAWSLNFLHPLAAKVAPIQIGWCRSYSAVGVPPPRSSAQGTLDCANDILASR